MTRNQQLIISQHNIISNIYANINTIITFYKFKFLSGAQGQGPNTLGNL